LKVVILTPLLPRTLHSYKLLFPRLSYGNSNMIPPATRNSDPAMYIGTGVSKLAYIAMTGANIPPILFAVAARPFPVPLAVVGNTSGVYAKVLE
jgi:hypothetical protein